MNAHKHPFTTGLLWWKLSLGLLRQQPLALISLVFFYVLLLLLLSLIPMIGTWLAMLLAPALAAGFALANQRVAQQQRISPQVFFEVWMDNHFKTASTEPRTKMRFALFKLGAFYTLGFLLACAVSVLFDQGHLFSILVLQQEPTTEILQQVDLRHAQLVLASLFLPLQMLFWFAPLLVLWHGLSPAKALFFSAIAIQRNLGALLLLLLCLLASAFAVLPLLGVLQVLLGQNSLSNVIQGFFVAMVGAAWVAWLNCANYISYVKIFQAESTHAASPT